MANLRDEGDYDLLETDEESREFDEDDLYDRASRDSDDPIFDYDEDDLEGSRFDPECEEDPM
jgi:hypothetical protein